MKWPRVGPPLAILLLLVTAALAGLGAWQMVQSRRADPVQSFSAASEALDAAVQSTQAILTYSFDSVDSTVSYAERLTTGQFRDWYRNFTQSTLIPKARANKVSTNAAVVGAGIETFSTENATVLLFINQTTTSAADPTEKLATSSARVDLEKVGGRWLIAKFENLQGVGE